MKKRVIYWSGIVLLTVLFSIMTIAWLSSDTEDVPLLDPKSRNTTALVKNYGYA
jgi:hypothetical protein